MESPTVKKPLIIRLKEFLQNFHDTDEYAKDRAFCFIIGSGAALTAGIPTGASLVNRWLVEMHDMDDTSEIRILPPHAKIEDYADALLDGEMERLKKWCEHRFEGVPGFSFEQRSKYYGHIYQARFSSDPSLGQQFLRKLIHRRKPSIGFHLLARILNRTRHNVVITTNFDHLVEDAIAITENEAIQSFNHEGLAEFVQRKPEHPAVAKIHGDILLKSFNAAEELDQLSAPWVATLRTLFQSYTPIVIGYGGNDPGFMNFLHDEMKSWGDGRRCYWFVRSESRFQCIPFCEELSSITSLRLVECPGFTELMLKLNEIFAFEPLHQELTKRADAIASELRDADARARGDLADHERKNRELLDNKDIRAASDQQDGFENSSIMSWNEWRRRIDTCDTAAEKLEMTNEALKHLPENLSFQSIQASLRLAKNPKDEKLLELIQKLLRQSESQLGPESEETLLILQSLAIAYGALEKHEKAEAIFRRVMAERQRLLGAEHLDTLKSWSGLAASLAAQGKIADAEREFRTLLACQSRLFAAENRETLITRKNIARAMAAQANPMEAENEYRAIVSIQTKLLGKAHPDTLDTRNNLANLIERQGRYAEAETEHRQILADRGNEKQLDYYGSCYNLAGCLWRQGKRNEALEFAKEAHAGFNDLGGPTYSYTINAKGFINHFDDFEIQQPEELVP